MGSTYIFGQQVALAVIVLEQAHVAALPAQSKSSEFQLQYI